MQTRSARVATGLAILVFVVVNLVNAINKGGDFDAYLEAGRRLASDRDLYAGSDIAVGFVGPPAQALLFVPLAPLADLPARIVWYAVNLLLLAYAIRTWVHVLVPGGWRPGSATLTLTIVSLLAVGYPLQTQFEHQNLNVVLLALTAAGASALQGGRQSAGGTALGVAAALKVYPALLLVWLAVRRSWTALAVGTVATVVISIAPVLFQGPADFIEDFRAWQRIAESGWPARRANQSLAAMWGRYLTAADPDDYGTLTYKEPLALWLAAGTSLLVIVPLARAAWRRRASGDGIAEEIACVNALAVLLSPIAWEHYWVALFPACLALAVRAWQPALASEPRRTFRTTLLFLVRRPSSLAPAVAFAIGLVCITLLSRPIVGWHGARAVRAMSLMTWGGVAVCAALARQLGTRDSSYRRSNV